MFPYSAEKDVPNRLAADTHEISQSLLRDTALGIALSDHANLIRSNLRLYIGNVSGSAVLCCHISHIIGVRAQEKMIRADTRWVIADMTNFPIGWNRASYQFVGDAMGIYVRSRSSADRKHPVALWVSSPSPQPTVA